MLAYLIQLFLFDQVPTILTIIGALMILFCMLITDVREIVDVQSRSVRLRRFFGLPPSKKRDAEEKELQHDINYKDV